MKKNILRILTGILICVSFFLLLFGSKITQAQQEKISYNTFESYVQEGKVELVNINEDTGKMTFSLKDDDTKYYTTYPGNDDFKLQLLKQDVEIKVTEESWMTYLLKYASLPIMMAIIVLLASSIMPGNSFEIENSSNIKTKFDDVAGMEEIKEDLLLLSKMMKDKKSLESGARIPRGVLLQGPPGNGKTLLARAFAGETGVNFIAASASDFSSQFVGIGSSRVKQLFKMAKSNAPCVVFIDEIDGVGSKRVKHNDAAGKEMNTILTSLLNQMDGFDAADNVMVLAATNRVDDLDEALIRPGRFDRQFVVSHPDKKARVELLELYSKKAKLADDVSLDDIANRTFGYSASKVSTLVNEAIILSLKNEEEKVTAKDFSDAAIQMEIKGAIKKNFQQTEKERDIVAYHEAGHAVMAYLYTTMDVTTITIRPTTSGAGGFTITEPDENNKLESLEEIRGHLRLDYGGRAAEYRLGGKVLSNVTSGASADMKEATEIAASYVCLEDGIDYSAFGDHGMDEILKKVKVVLSEVWDETIKAVDENWDKVDAVAKKLIEKETLTKAEFLEIVEEETEKEEITE